MKYFLRPLELIESRAHLTCVMSTDAAYPQNVAACHAVIDQQNNTIAQMQRELEQFKHFVALR